MCSWKTPDNTWKSPGTWKTAATSFNSASSSKYSGSNGSDSGSQFGPVGYPFRVNSQGSWGQSSTGSPASSHAQGSIKSCCGEPVRGYAGCTLCYQNKEVKAIYMSHSLKNEEGKVTCPILYANVCPYCGATGPNAHTKNYCPMNPQQHSFKSYLKYRNASGGKYGNPNSKY